MEIDIKNFIEEVSENTGVKLSVFDLDGKDLLDSNHVEKIPTDFRDVFSDVVYKRTLFHLKFKSKLCIGKLEGAGKTERNYAYLISALSEKFYSADSSLTKDEFYKAVFLGEASYYQIEKYTKKYQIKTSEVCAMIISYPDGKGEDVKNIIVNYSDNDSDLCLDLFDGQFVLIKFSDDTVEEYQSYTNYAEFLTQSIYEEIGVNVQISIGGSVKDFSKLYVSFVQAGACERMGKTINNSSSVHSYKEYMLYKMLEDLPKNKAIEYLNQLLDDKAKEVFDDEEMASSAEEFLENNLNVSETSRKLYLHRNTLIYRLDKIEKATGLDIRKFSDAVTFRLITYLLKLSR